MYIVPFIVISLFAGGCAADSGLGTLSESQQNISNLSRLTVGMSEDQVLCIMKRPHSQETIAMESETYDIWFYVTKPTVLGQSQMVSLNLTPVTFKNGALVGMGTEYYKKVLKQHNNIQTPKPQAAPPEETNELQKALQSISAPQHKSATSMSSPPKKADSEDNDKEDKPPLKESDEDMIRRENDQNFDFW